MPIRKAVCEGLKMLTQHKIMINLTAYLFLALTMASIIPNVDMNPIINSKQQDISSTMEAEYDAEIKTNVPRIGILTQVLRDYKRFVNNHSLHTPSSYVKWIESAGAQVIPIMLNKNDAYYEKMFKQTNGLLLPGGDNLLNPHLKTPMLMAARKLYKLAVDAAERSNDFYPIWGTCLGMELLTVLSSGKNELENCQAIDLNLKMDFVDRGRLFEKNKNANLHRLDELDYSGMIKETLTRKRATYNYHHKCVTDSTLERSNLKNFYKPLAYSYDESNVKFIAIMEAYNYPFYAVQFHPEKPAFEFSKGAGHNKVPHTRESIEVSRYLADFFVHQAQKNGHEQLDERQLDLIYKYNATYTAPLDDMYEQRYIFPFKNNSVSQSEIVTNMNQMISNLSNGTAIKNDLTIEFVDRVPQADEVIPEDL